METRGFFPGKPWKNSMVSWRISPKLIIPMIGSIPALTEAMGASAFHRLHVGVLWTKVKRLQRIMYKWWLMVTTGYGILQQNPIFSVSPSAIVNNSYGPTLDPIPNQGLSSSLRAYSMVFKKYDGHIVNLGIDGIWWNMDTPGSLAPHLNYRKLQAFWHHWAARTMAVFSFTITWVETLGGSLSDASPVSLKVQRWTPKIRYYC